MHCASCWVSVDVHSAAACSCCQHRQARVHSHPRRDGRHQLVAQLRQLVALVVEHVHLRTIVRAYEMDSTPCAKDRLESLA